MFRVFLSGTEETPIVYDEFVYTEFVRDVASLEGVRDILDRVNIRTREKREFFMAIRKARVYITAEKEMFQEEADDGSWAIMYWKL